MRLSESELHQPVTHFLTPIESTVQLNQTVAEALASIRRRQIKHAIVYFYALDSEGRLSGVIPTRKLLLAEPDARIDSLIRTTAIAIPADATLELALELFAMHRLLALPVVDDQGRFLGVVDVQLYAEEAADLADSEHRRDLFQLLGVRLEALRRPSPIGAYKLRMPWLVCNMIGGLACAVIAAVFKDVLATVVVLAMFIPLVLTLCESISMQSMTLGLQFLHAPGVPWRQVWHRAKLEWPTAGMMGLTSAVAVALAALMWGEGWQPAAVIGISIAASMVLAATVGLAMPVALHAMRLDPRFAAGPAVLMITDVVATGFYLGLATWWLL